MAATDEVLRTRAAVSETATVGGLDAGAGDGGPVAAAFRSAAVRLAGSDVDSDAARSAAREAADALIELAGEKHDAVLQRLLRPDPEVNDATWTVACYQIGDLTPNTLQDFSDPTSAIATLAGCGDASHVAAELLVSSTAGTRWTALARAGDVVTFQLPGIRTASHASREQDGDLPPALGHWAGRIARWAAEPEAAESEPRKEPPDADLAPFSILELSSGLDAVVEALRSIERQDRQGYADIIARLDLIDHRLAVLESGHGSRRGLLQATAALRGLAERTRSWVRGTACPSEP